MKTKLEFNQGQLIKNLTEYLIREQRDEEFIDSFKNTNGFCFGINALWIYANTVTHRAEKKEPSGRHDIDWFKNTLDLISNLDKKKELSQEEKYTLDEFLSLMISIHSPTTIMPNTSQQTVHSKLEELYEEKAQKPLDKFYTISGGFDQEALVKFFSKVSEHLPPGTGIQINNFEHTVGAFFTGEGFLYSDSSRNIFDDQEYSPQELSEKILNIKTTALILDDEPFPYNITLFTAPNQEIDKVIKQTSEKLNHVELIESLGLDREYENLHTAQNLNQIHLAALNSDLFSLKFYFGNTEGKKEINCRTKMDWTPLHMAVLTDSMDVICFLIDKGSNLKLETNNNKTPFDLAILNHRYKTAALLKLAEYISEHNKEQSILSPLQNDPEEIQTAKKLCHMLKNNELDLDTLKSFEKKIPDPELYKTLEQLLLKDSEENTSTFKKEI